MNINIVLNYKDSDKYYRKWANDEENICFETDTYSATRCTVSYAAQELFSYLEKLGHSVSVSNERKAGINIVISAGEDDNEEFNIRTDGSDIFLEGKGRKGALYSAYELLEIQGVRWYSPMYEYVPVGREFVFPQNKQYKYDLSDGRGFHFEQPSKESRSLAIWMARNRLNIHGCHTHNKKLQQKLCFTFMAGGHIFHELLAPDRIAEDGRVYFDAHRDWYGKYDGVTMEYAQSVQLCVSNSELLEEMARVIIQKLKCDWKDADICELGTFDTWGEICNCENCRKLGNGSDHLLHFISHIRKRINEAYDRGELQRQVKLCYDIYEGTCSLCPPQNPIPQNILDAGDIAMFCPISRCYAHDFADEACPMNFRYREAFEEWSKKGAKILVNEYYNVSWFDDLPILFTKSMGNDIRYYIDNGVKNIVYMHVPVLELGPRVLTQYLYANITRDKNCDYYQLINEYFDNLYGKNSDKAKKAYELIEEATKTCASWRTAGEMSAVVVLREWNLEKPMKPLCQKPRDPLCKNPDKLYKTNRQEVINLHCETHFDGNLSGNAYACVEKLNASIEVMREIKKNILAEFEDCTKVRVSLNKVNEDIRSLIYCRDIYEFMALFFNYYDAMYEEREDIAKLEGRILELGQKMSEYTFGVRYEPYKYGMVTVDVLRRSRMEGMYYKLLAKVNKSKG